MNIDLGRIQSLPDSISRDEIKNEFKALLAQYGQIPHLTLDDRNILLTAVLELADRQWNTYELLSTDLKDKLESMILDLWQRDSVDSTEMLLAVIARLGLIRAFATLVAIDSLTLASGVAAAIQAGIAEFGETVENPYSGM